MSLASTARLAPNFTAGELGADHPEIPAAALGNLYRVAAWLQSARGQFGNRAVSVTNGFRTPQHNAAVGGSDSSDHVNGLAADFRVSGVSQLGQYNAMKAGGFPPWDQIIFYPLTGHTHVGLGPRMRGEFRIKLAEPGYPLLTPALVSKLRGATPALLAILAVLLLLAAAARKGT